jgi:hypothetical protein
VSPEPVVTHRREDFEVLKDDDVDVGLAADNADDYDTLDDAETAVPSVVTTPPKVFF